MVKTMRTFTLCFLVAITPVIARAAAPFPLVPGEAVITCFSDNNPNNPVVAIFDIRNPAANAPGLNTNWAAPSDHLPSWNQSTFGGEVFGIALDDSAHPNIYVTSSTAYTGGIAGSTAPGSGQVFKIDGVSGVAAPLGAPLPNTGQGLGNIAYDPVHRQLFVTNWYDGKIYRLDSATGAIKSTFDPFVAFTATQSTPKGYVQTGERLWGIGVFENRVYFARWAPSSVYSVGLDTTGGFSGAESIEFTVTPVGGIAMPIADIEFNTAKEMLVAERGMVGSEVSTTAHQSRVLKFVRSGATWGPSSQTFAIGSLGSPPSTTNAAGGVAYSCPLDGAPDAVVATGDALQFGPQLIYGLQILPAGGGGVANSFLVDADNKINSTDKTQIGDVDVFNTCDRTCLKPAVKSVLCTTDGSGDYLVTFDFKNETQQTIHHLFITGLPGGVTAIPNYVPIVQPLAPGGTTSVGPIRIHGATAGALTFTVSIHNAALVECCSTRITVELPRCLCAQVIADKPASCNYLGSTYTYTFSLQNLFTGPVSFISITPDPAGGPAFSPNLIPLSTPMAPGAIQTFTITIANATPGKPVCFRIGTHNENFEECCSIRRCITVPNCYDLPYDPDISTDLDLTPQGLVLQSPDGRPGVTIPLPPNTAAVDLYWNPIAETLPNGSFIEQRLRGRVGEATEGTLATTRSVVTAAGTEFRTSFPILGTTRSRYEFLRDGVVVGTTGGVPIDVAPICNGCGVKLPTRDAHFSVLQFTPASEENEPDCFEQGHRCLFAGYTFQFAESFALPNFGTPFVADEIRVYPEDGVAGRLRLSALELEAQGPKRITLTSIAIATDCNGNSIDDRIDIAEGTSLDVDENGVADECQGVGEDLTLSLNTGFDQATNSLLARGASDDDWRITNAGVAGPAKVVVNPNRNWAAALPGSAWISISANRGASNPLLENIDFENCFCIGAGATAAELNLQLRADNFASVFLNDAPISNTGGGFAGSPLNVHRTGAVGGSGPFRVGRNCVRVRVNDTGGIVTGLDLSGTVRAEHGSCSQ